MVSQKTEESSVFVRFKKSFPGPWAPGFFKTDVHRDRKANKRDG